MLKTKKGFIIRLRQSRTFRGMVVMVVMNLVMEIFYPTVSLALTEGPSQPEVQSFEPIGTNQMVDLFTGDFNYNIPLFNLPGPNGGYPVNIAYHAGTTMDDEASWVGLGWNINVGSIQRNMRGLPDEFMSEVSSGHNVNSTLDYIKVKSDMKQNWTLGGSISYRQEIAGANTKIDLSANASVYYNNYNGIGLTVGGNVGKEKSPFSYGLSLDSENGAGISFSCSVEKERDNYTNTHKLSLSFDGKLSVNYSLSSKKKYEKQEWVTMLTEVQNSGPLSSPGTHLQNVSVKALVTHVKNSQIGSGISFARSSFYPTISNNVTGYSLNLSLYGGAEATGFFSSWGVGIFYNTQDYSEEDKDGALKPVVGYARSGKEIGLTDDRKYTRDFSRVHDGQISKSNEFLPHSIYTYDIYQSTGQGLSGYFRARRSDIGRSFDPENANLNFGVSASLEMGATSKAGFDIGVSFGWSKQDAWDDENNLDLEFQHPAGSGITENVYYQAHGENTILNSAEFDYMGGLGLASVTLRDKHDDGNLGAKRRINSEVAPYSWQRTVNERVVRNNLVHSLENQEVANLGEFNIKYFSAYSQPTTGTPATSFDRTYRNGVNIKRHPAGFKELNSEGTYYVYGLPAYNVNDVENTFTVSMPSNADNVSRISSFPVENSEVKYKLSGTNKYINKVSKSPYAHSYLLTSVQGADYVDVTNDGPSDDDLGYWVKFNYVKHQSNFKWRAPYTGAMYNRGAIYTSDDDVASYQYGEKELWYLGQIETKSHIAVFVLEPRADQKDASGEFAVSSNQGSNTSLRVSEVKIYEKTSFKSNPQTAVPLQTVVFNYDYSLCQGSPNSTGTNQAKLTLKSLYFLSNGSTRGALNKYQFEYGSGTYANPSYTENAYDNWGNYKPLGTKYEHQAHFPYVNQFNQDWGSGTWEPSYGSDLQDEAAALLTKNTQDALVSAWNLSKIKLPSGGEINVQYESDDYGYVQHKTANQMFKIRKLGRESTSDPDDQIYPSGSSNNYFYNTGSTGDEERRRIYFKLEKPIKATTSASACSQQVYGDYVEPLIQDEEGKRNLYFKVKMRLTSEVYDYVSGYLPLESYSTYNYGVGSWTATIDGASCYTHGFVTVQAAKKKNGNYFDNYHPLALAGWTYLQVNAQKLLNNPNSLESEETYGNAKDLLNKLVDLVNIIPATANNFGNIRKYCRNKGLAQYIDLDYSVIKLASPDKIKYGGGHRVKQITIKDNWSSQTDNTESDHTYGQVYDYTIVENGKIISSGVAQYEPQAGGDENPLKYPIYYYDKQNYFTNNNLFTEAPLNEDLFPGASVGYRRVAVRSLNTATQMKNATSGGTAVGRTGGVTVNTFYTAKEFPTMVEHSLLSEENNTKNVFNLPILIPLIGSIKRNYYHGTQAYKIELNDMHGKLKSVETFELNGYNLNASPITSTVYEYQKDPVVYQGENVFRVNNNVKVIKNDGTFTEADGTYLLGVEADLFTDQRESKTFFQEAGVAFNLDIVLICPLPSIWPIFNNHKTLFRTYVTNKVVHRSGILKKTITRDLQASNESEIIAYDEKSGQPVLTRMKNEFGDDFYNYSIPTYYKYDRMGHAYSNINYQFATSLSSAPSDNSGNIVRFVPTASELAYLFKGDEVLINVNPNVETGPYYKGYFLGWQYNCDASGGSSTQTYGLIHVPQAQLMEGVSGQLSTTVKVVRSGRRNHYATMAASYLTKGKIPASLADHTLWTSPLDNSTVKTKDLPANMVLAASATVFRDDWPPLKTYYSKSGTESDGTIRETTSQNPFLTGSSGIWRPLKTYTYVGSRKNNADLSANTTTQNNQLYNDGVFENVVPAFTWDLGNMEDYVSNWEWVNEVTRYSYDSYETENINRLGIYSSALYGYDNSLSIAVGGNASYFELGTDDFETLSATSDSYGRTKQNNMNFYANYAGNNVVTTSEHAAIKYASYSCSTNTLQVKLVNPSEYMKYLIQSIVSAGSGYTGPSLSLSLTTIKNNASQGNKSFLVNGSCSSYTSATDANGNLVYTVSVKPYYYSVGESDKALMNKAEFHGKMTAYKLRPILENNYASSVSYVTTKAHTGKKSMKIASGNTVTFDQPMLRALKNKKYILSYWVARDNTNVRTYQPQSGLLLTPGYMSGSAFTAFSSAAYNVTYSKVIEGWQKVDIEFSTSLDDALLAFRFASGTSALYVDDIRFSPKTGGITTYVYDPVKFWLRASLNVDNYATLFFYDEEGNLSLKKQETEDGIFTLMESRGHIKE